MKHLDALTARAKEAAKAVNTALQFDTVESRRERVLDYGRALLAIRKEIASKNAFHAHLKKNGLLVRDRAFRANAIWLAENYDDVGICLHQCPHSHPDHIRQWLRQHGTQAGDGKTKEPVDYSDLPMPIDLGPYSKEFSDGNPWAPSGVYPGLEHNRQGKRVGDHLTDATPHMLACSHLWAGQPLDGLTAAICYGCCDLRSAAKNLEEQGLKLNFGRIYHASALARLNQHGYVTAKLPNAFGKLSATTLIPEYKVVQWPGGKTKPPGKRNERTTFHSQTT
jgi:hypothetical protein